MSDILSNDFRNFNCCSGGSFSNFATDKEQSSNYIAPSDKDGSGIEVSLGDVTRFAVGNIAEIKGNVYNGNFEVSRVWQRSGSNGGTIFLKTKFLFNSPTAIKDAAWANGYVDRAVHLIKNLTMFSPDVNRYAKQLVEIIGKPDRLIYKGVGTGLVEQIYKYFKKTDQKGVLAKDEVNYLKDKAIAACNSCSGGTVRRCKEYVEKHYNKLWDGVTIYSGESIPTTNESPVAGGGNGSGGNSTGSGAGASVSGASMTKYLFLGVAAIGAFFLIRSIVKKQ